MRAMIVAFVITTLFGLKNGQRRMTDGSQCVFPFVFQDETYDDCVEFSGFQWCQDKDGNFGTCEPDSSDVAAVGAMANGDSNANDENPEEEEAFVAALNVPSPSPSLDNSLLGVQNNGAIETIPQANREVPPAATDTAAPTESVGIPSILTEKVPVDVTVDTMADSPIVINELATNEPVGGKDWFEIYNKGDTIVDLVDWSVKDGDGNSFVIGGDPICRDPFLTEILPGQFLKLSRDVQCSFEFGFGGEDSIFLYNAQGDLVDSITWTTPDTFPTLSIGRHPDGESEMVILKPTPGAKNEPANPFFIDATSQQGDGLLGRDHECCQRLKNIGFDPSVPVMIIDTFGQSLLHKTSLTDDQWQLIIDTYGLGVNPLKVPSRICTCSDYEDYDGWAGVQYRGQTSFREFDKKGIGFELREEDNQTNRNFPLLGLPRENDWVLNNPENDGTLGFRNVMAYTLAAQMGQYASRWRFMELFLVLDGSQEVTMDHYEGIYMLLEKVKRDSNRVAIKKRSPTNITGGYIWKYDNDNIDPYDVYFQTFKSNMPFVFSYPETPTPEEIQYATDYFNNFETALLAQNFADPKEGYRKYIDYYSFIDFLLAVEITKNPDGYRGSTYIYKDAGGPLSMGPIWDVNEAFGQCCWYPIEGYQKNGKSDGYSGGSAISPEGFRFLICVDANRCKVDPSDGVSQWYRQMWTDPTFRKDTYDRWVELRKDKISNEFILNLFNDTTEMLREAAYRNYERWVGGRLFTVETAVYPDDYEKEWLNDIEVLKTWLIAHMDWMDLGWKRFSA